MRDGDKTKTQLLDELAALRERVAELETAVTASQKPETALQKGGESYWQQMVENIHEVFWVGTPDWNEILYISPAYEIVWGRSCASLYEQPRSWMEAVVDEDRDMVAAALDRRIAGDLTFRFPEYRIMRPDGEIRWVLARAFPVYDDQGEIQRIVGITEDITERKQTEESLRKQQAILTKAHQLARIGSHEWHIPTNTMRISPELANLLGIAFTGEWIPIDYTMTHPDDRARAREYDESLKSSSVDNPTPFEYRTVHADGSVRWLWELPEIRRDAAGKPEHVLFIIQDITEWNQINETLRESEARFRAFMDNAPFAAYIKNEQLRHVYGNKSALEWTSVSYAEFLGTTAADFMPPDVVELLTEADHQVLRTGESVTLEGYAVQFRDELHWNTQVKFPIAGPQGERLIGGIVIDITEQKQAEQQVLDLILEKERTDTLRTLIGNIAHDIKTPLAGINTSLYLLERHTDPVKRQEKIGNIQAHIQSLESFIQDLLALSRLDSGPELRLLPVDINEIIINVEEQMRPVLEKKNLNLTLDLSENLPLIQADETDIRRALINLTENAIHYTPEGGSITIRTARVKGGIRVEITDTGIGIKEDDLPHIFDRFYRASQAQAMTMSGAGLGLAIVQRIIDLHGGQIEVESAAHNGSTFRIWLPQS